MKNYYFLLFILVINTAYSQCDIDYTPIKTTKLEEKEKLLAEKYKVDIEKINSPYKKEVKAFYSNQLDYMTVAIDSNEFYYKDSLFNVVEKIFNHIIESNPNLKDKEINLFLSKFTWPNATTHIDGSIVVNLGLLRFIENEDQLAFIICHELAHYYLNHLIEDINKKYDYINSKEFKEKLEKIKDSKYYVNTQLKDLLKDFSFDNRRHSRYKEAEADSIGLTFLINTKYSQLEAISCLALLDSMDVEKATDSISVKTIFSYPKYPFKSSWLKTSSFLKPLKDSIKEKELDSLKTHPDCIVRVSNIKRQIGSIESNTTSTNIGNIRYLSSMEFVHALYNNNELNNCIYWCTVLQKDYPNNLFLKLLIAKSFNKMHYGLKTHHLNQYLSLPSPLDKGSFKDLNIFLNKITLSELDEIYFNYMLSITETCDEENDELLYYLYLSAKNVENEQIIKKSKETLLNKFPNSIFVNKLN